MKVTFDDVVFETRNKEYGAYYLRKNYRRYLTRATVTGTVLFCLVFVGAFVFARYQDKAASLDRMVILSAHDLIQEEPDKPIELPEEVPPPPLDEPLPEVAQEKFLPPEPKKDEDVVIEEPPPPAEKLETAVISNKTVAGVEAANVFIPPPPPKEVTVVKIAPAPEEEIFYGVEQQPEYPGGLAAFQKFLQKNVVYPAAAQRAGISGKVIVQFVVEPDGSVGQVQVIKSVGFGCDEEAVRVIKAMPKWSPGRQNGRPVRVYYSLPVAYVLE